MYNKQELIKELNRGKEFSYIYFWGHRQKEKNLIDKSCLSQWFPSQFIVEGDKYLTAEHYMMAQKAKLFGDSDVFEQILYVKTPKEAKDLGRKVRFFDVSVWENKAFDIVVKGNFEKFSQNKPLKNFLIETYPQILVETSPVDKIWGIGLAQDNKKVNNPSEWKGENKLGFALMQVRDMF